MNNELTLLGTGTCNLVPDKAASSVLIQRDALRLVYDFGRGTAIRLTQAGMKQDDIEHIFISHFHPDHVTDLLPYLHAASWSQIDKRTKDLAIYGPPGTKEFIGKLISVFGLEELSRGFELTIHEVTEGEFGVAGQQFTAIDLHHSYGIRFGNCAIAGDAQVNEDLIRLLKDAEVGVFDAGHISDGEISDVAVRSQAKTLICSHQYRGLDADKLNQAAQSEGYTGKIIVAHDLMKQVL